MPSRYRISKTLSSEDNRQYLGNTIYPDIPLSENDIYIITTAGDRYDILANQFYGDTNLWWVIPAANGISKRDSLYPTPGLQLRIPENKDNIFSVYESTNQRR